MYICRKSKLNINMTIQDRFRGTGVALITPFTEDNKVDFKSLEKLLNHVIGGDVEFLVVSPSEKIICIHAKN